MFDFMDTIVELYEPKQKTVQEALTRLGVTTGLDTSMDQYGNQQSLSAIYGNSTWAYRSINFISSNLARLPWIYKKGDKDITDTIKNDVFQDPNPMQTRYDFLMESISRLELQGEMFWELYHGSAAIDRRVIAIFPDWRSEEVTVVPDQKKYQIKKYVRYVNGKPFEFDSEEVFYIKYFNPNNPLRGLAPLYPARHSAVSDLNATYYTKQFFKQGARPSGILTTDQSLSSLEQTRLQEYIKKKYQSVEQMHEILILWSGLDYKPLNTMSMTDMQFEKLKGMTREEIISTFGLSLEVMGLGRKTYENVQFFRRMAWTETLQPLMDKILGLLNKDLIEELYGMEGVTAEADYSNVEALREERSKKVIDFEKGAKLGAVTPNEIRENVFGFDPIVDPAMDATYILSTMEPVIQEEEPPEGGGAPIVPDEEEPKRLRKLGQKGLTYDDRTKIWKLKVKQLEPFEPVFKSILSEWFDEINKSLKSNISMLFEKGFKIEDEGVTVPPSVVVRARKFFDVEYWKKRLVEKGTPIIAATMKFSADQLLQNEGLVLDPVHPFVRNMIGQRVKSFSEFVSTTTSEDINKLVRLTLQETAHLSTAEQTKALQKVFDKYNVTAKKNRAALIARTETMSAANAGTQAALIQGKFPRKMWITSRDDNVRDSHRIDGQVVNADENFTLADGSSMFFPQDFNERCTMTATLEPKI